MLSLERASGAAVGVNVGRWWLYNSPDANCNLTMSYYNAAGVYQGDNLVFMDTNTGDQIYVGKDKVGDEARFLDEGLEVEVTLFNGNAIGITAASKGPYRRWSRKRPVIAVSPAISSRAPSRSTTNPVHPRWVSRPSRAPQCFTSIERTRTSPRRVRMAQ